MAWFVYIARCSDGTLYTGIAKNVAERIAKHNAGEGAKYTRTRRPIRLVYSEPAADRSAAQSREYEIKSLHRSQKEALVAAALQTISMAEIAARKQASRDEDARALASGEKTQEDLRRENGILSGAKIVIHFDKAKPLR